MRCFTFAGGEFAGWVIASLGLQGAARIIGRR